MLANFEVKTERPIGAARRLGKEYYFFYGSLMDPTTLKKVLGVKETPVLQDAFLMGYTIKMWGQYPALLTADELEKVVHGKVCIVDGQEQKQRLRQYESCNYREHWCDITLPNHVDIPGVTFLWVGDESELKEGSFDLKDWQLDHVLDE